MAPPTQQLLPALDEISDVIRSVAGAPRPCTPQGWRLDMGPDRWRILVNGTSDARTAGRAVLLGAGIAAEHLLIALEAQHHRAVVQVLPPDDPRVAVSVRTVGHLHPSALMTELRDLALRPEQRPAPCSTVTPSDLRVLGLTAAARSALVRWPDPADSGPAVLQTYDDDPDDAVRAGRALARLLLRATALGFEARACFDGSGRGGAPSSEGGATQQVRFVLTGRV